MLCDSFIHTTQKIESLVLDSTSSVRQRDAQNSENYIFLRTAERNCQEVKGTFAVNKQ